MHPLYLSIKLIIYVNNNTKLKKIILNLCSSTLMYYSILILKHANNLSFNPCNYFVK